MPVQERRRIGRQSVLRSVLRQKCVNGEKIAQCAHPAFRGVAPLRKRRGGRIAFGNRGEDFQVYGSLQGLGLLVSIHGIEEAFRRRLLRRRDSSHRYLSSGKGMGSINHRCNPWIFSHFLYSWKDVWSFLLTSDRSRRTIPIEVR